MRTWSRASRSTSACAPIARQKAPAIWQQQIEAWEARQAGDTADAERRFEAAQRLAKARGFRFLSADKVAQLPREDLLARVEAATGRGGEPDTKEAAALSGGFQEPSVTETRALGLHWELAKDRTRGKSADQLRRWVNPRKKAVKNFVEVVGDKAVREMTGDDMLDFSNWRVERMEEERLTPDSANKDFIHLGDDLKTANMMKRLGLVLPLSGYALKKGDE